MTPAQIATINNCLLRGQNVAIDPSIWNCFSQQVPALLVNSPSLQTFVDSTCNLPYPPSLALTLEHSAIYDDCVGVFLTAIIQLISRPEDELVIPPNFPQLIDRRNRLLLLTPGRAYINKNAPDVITAASTKPTTPTCKPRHYSAQPTPPPIKDSTAVCIQELSDKYPWLSKWKRRSKKNVPEGILRTFEATDGVDTHTIQIVRNTEGKYDITPLTDVCKPFPARVPKNELPYADDYADTYVVLESLFDFDPDQKILTFALTFTPCLLSDSDACCDQWAGDSVATRIFAPFKTAIDSEGLVICELPYTLTPQEAYNATTQILEHLKACEVNVHEYAEPSLSQITELIQYVHARHMPQR